MADSLLYVADTDIFPRDLRAAFEAYNEGIVAPTDLEVTAGATGLSIDVGDGTAFVQGDAVDDQGLYRVHIDTPQNSSVFVTGGIDSADATDPRVDRVILRVYDDVEDGSGDTAWYLEVLTGVPTTGATLVNENGAQSIPDTALHLANVLVPATATSIVSGDIEDVRVSAFEELVSGAVADHGPTHEQDSTDPIPSLPTADQKDAMDGASAPDGANPFATIDDLIVPGLAGHVVADEATPLTQRGTLAFEGAGVTASDDSGGGRTVVTIPGSSGGIDPNTIDAAGDLLVGTADNAVDNLPVGSEEDVFAVDAGVPAWVNPKQVLPTRVFQGFNTSSLANNASDATIVLGMEPSARAIMFESNYACRFRLYMTSADRTADAARAIGTDPTGDHGLIMEVVTTGAMLVVRLTPQVDMSADPYGDQTRQYAVNYYVAVTNLSGATHVINCTLTYLPTERR